MFEGHDVEALLCTLREENVSVCAYCKFAYESAEKYVATFGAYGYTNPPVVSSLVSLTRADNLKQLGGFAVYEATEWGKPVSKPRADNDSTGWAVYEMKMSSDKKRMECTATYTDPTDGTRAREKVVKEGMASVR